MNEWKYRTVRWGPAVQRAVWTITNIQEAGRELSGRQKALIVSTAHGIDG
jgi:hypothetical protein